MTDREQALIQERDELRQTVKRLNRRCQTLEAGVAEKVRDNPGGSLGRSLANAQYTYLEGERDLLRAALMEIAIVKTWARGAATYCVETAVNVLAGANVAATADAAVLRDMAVSLEEVRTNGEWTDGEQCGDWMIAPEVYAMVTRSLDKLAALADAREAMSEPKPETDGG